MKSIYIYGASGHGLVVAEIAKLAGYSNIIFIDDGENECLTFDDIKNSDKNIPLALGIGSNRIREKLFNKVKKLNINIVTLIHPTAVVSPTAVIEEGTVIMANVTVNAKSHIGKAAILNTSCVIEHENIIGDFSHVSPTAALAGNVTIGQLAHIGIGSCIIQGISIGNNTIIGAGSVVTKDFQDDILAYGVPCKEIKDLSE